MYGNPAIPAPVDDILTKPYRILGTTDNRYATNTEAINNALSQAQSSGKRIYVVKVTGYAEPITPPVLYREL
jgi:activator of 2-hydroxyglutaryl-CoA dehydratase